MTDVLIEKPQTNASPNLSGDSEIDATDYNNSFQSVNMHQEAPDWLPEGISSIDDFIESYNNLKQNAQKQKSGDDPIGVDFDHLKEEFFELGEISDNSKQSLSDAGIPEEMLEAFIEGQKALINQSRAELFNSVGGEENFNQVIKWSENHLSQADKQAYNNIVDKGDVGQIKLALLGLHNQYNAKNFKTPSLLNTASKPVFESGYRSWAELTEAIKDTRYAKDEAYRKDVENKIALSKF